jgi:hypothetical protein
MGSFMTLYLHFMRNRGSRCDLRALTQFALLAARIPSYLNLSE